MNFQQEVLFLTESLIQGGTTKGKCRKTPVSCIKAPFITHVQTSPHYFSSSFPVSSTIPKTSYLDINKRCLTWDVKHHCSTLPSYKATFICKKVSHKKGKQFDLTCAFYQYYTGNTLILALTDFRNI